MHHPHRFLLATLLWSLAALQSAAAQTVPQDRDDVFEPRRNAVAVALVKCTGTLITDRHLLTAAHCFGPRFRAPKPLVARQAPCTGLGQQMALQNGSWENPMRWYATENAEATARAGFGNRGRSPRLTLRVTAYSLPRCADLALLELEQPLPLYIARPAAVLTRPPPRPDRFFATAPLRHAGWGMPSIEDAPSPVRRTGPAGYWGRNACHLIALPPQRTNGRRILPGDSGAPLLLRDGNRDVLAAVLWGSGAIDAAACGTVLPPPPRRHGSYTPTWRGPIPGTGATDIGAWLRRMVPQADHLPPIR